jgi:hypothetical protein
LLPFCSMLNLVRSQSAVGLQVAHSYYHRIGKQGNEKRQQ